MTHWLLHDLSGVLPDYAFAMNPNRMDSPVQPVVLSSHGQMIDGHVRATGQKPPHDWTFSGVLYLQSQYESLQAWVAQAGQSHLTDHIGRTYLVRLKQFNPVRAGTRAHPWRHTYTINVTTYGGPL